VCQSRTDHHIASRDCVLRIWIKSAHGAIGTFLKADQHALFLPRNRSATHYK
jgi:hypothetical protein